MTTDIKQFGQGDSSFKAAGGEAGITALVDDFYDRMHAQSDYQRLREMHPADDSTSRDKLARFLCGWLGGPRRYNEKYGRISIPAAHQHLQVGDREHDQWLNCMAEAIDAQPFSPDFRHYLKAQLTVPAAAIRARSQQQPITLATLPIATET